MKKKPYGTAVEVYLSSLHSSETKLMVANITLGRLFFYDWLVHYFELKITRELLVN